MADVLDAGGEREVLDAFVAELTRIAPQHGASRHMA